MQMSRKFINIALIPARGGSSEIKNKNLQKIGKKSLVLRAVESCQEAGFFSKIILSSDSEEIYQEVFHQDNFNNLSNNSIVKISNNLFFHKRKKTQSTNSSSVYNLIKEIAQIESPNFNYMWLIQPTSPFRTFKEFSELKFLLDTKDFSSIVSVKDVTHLHPDRMFNYRGDFLEKYDLSNVERSIPRQLLPKIFVKDGGYYVFRSEILSQERYLGTEILPYIRSGINCINIDTIEDLHYAQYISKIKSTNDRYFIKFLKKFRDQVRVME